MGLKTFFLENSAIRSLALNQSQVKIGFGTDPIKEFMKLTDEAYQEFPNESISFASKLLFAKTNFFTKFLHNQTPLEIQERLHFSGRQMILLPMRVG